jgi:lipoyl(octanoyl) transferase
MLPYEAAWDVQKHLMMARRLTPELPDILLLLEHYPVYTLGQGATLDFVNFAPSATTPPLLRVERGGEVTYHCPGQLVGYPILNLQRLRPDLHWYLRQLEEVLIRTLAKLNLVGERVPGLTGVWVAGRKVAAIGIKASRWITMHGFALNVCPDMTGFQEIVPCGIGDRPVGSLADFDPSLTVAMVEPLLADSFAEVFGYYLLPKPPEDVWHPF